MKPPPMNREPSATLPAARLPLLSEEYRVLNAELHAREPNFGTTGRKYVDIVGVLARDYGARQILDYGCGKQDLSRLLGDKFVVSCFDPALPGLNTPPAPADLVACIDVLEHVESKYLENVLADLHRVTIKVAFFTIATGPSGKRLADGTNAHRIQEAPHWWRNRLSKYFRIQKADILQPGNGLQLILEPMDCRVHANPVVGDKPAV